MSPRTVREMTATDNTTTDHPANIAGQAHSL